MSVTGPLYRHCRDQGFENVAQSFVASAQCALQATENYRTGPQQQLFVSVKRALSLSLSLENTITALSQSPTIRVATSAFIGMEASNV